MKIVKFETPIEKLKAALLCAGSVYGLLKAIAYLCWRSKINRLIPGPPDNLLIGASGELQKAGLNDFWGFNPKLFKSLFARYGKIVRFWLPGTGLFICFFDTEDIAEMNKLCEGRPPLTETLLPYLGKDNLLFQKGPMIKQLRLIYQKMVAGRETLEMIHQIAFDAVGPMADKWGSNTSTNLHDELKILQYDIMGKALFGGVWSTTENGPKIRDTHLYLIQWSSRYGMKVLKDPSWGNFFSCISDLRAYFKAIKDLRDLCGAMIDIRRTAIAANPSAYVGDKTSLTMLVTEPVSSTDSTPFFSRELSISTSIGFLNGAFDTTLATSVWLFYHCAVNQEEQKKLIAQIDQAFGGKPSTLTQNRELKLLDAWVRESLRMRPTVPIGMRIPTEDVVIAGVSVPKGTTCLPFLDLREGTEKFFGPDVDVFRPDRFLGDSEQAKMARKSFDRFGGSARLCVGMTFALAELQAILVTVLQKHTVHLADPTMRDPEMIYEAGVYQPKEHISFDFRKR